MLGFFTAIYSGLTFLFTCIGVAFVAYKLYQRYFKRGTNNAPPNQEFENISRERLQRQEAVSIYATDSTLRLQNNAHQVVTRFKEQQAHLEKSITDVDRIIDQTKRTNSGLNEANSSLQNSVIVPIQALLTKIKAHFQETSSLISNLSAAMTNGTLSLSAREKEVKSIIENLAAAQSNIRSMMEQMPKVKLNADHVVKIERQFSEAIEKLDKLVKKCKEYEEIITLQKKLIELLQAKNQSNPTSHDCRLFRTSSLHSLSPDSRDKLDLEQGSSRGSVHSPPPVLPPL